MSNRSRNWVSPAAVSIVTLLFLISGPVSVCAAAQQDSNVSTSESEHLASLAQEFNDPSLPQLQRIRAAQKAREIADITGDNKIKLQAILLIAGLKVKSDLDNAETLINQAKQLAKETSVKNADLTLSLIHI